jgi:hypothetical protein
MSRSKILALIGVGLYVLQVLSSGTDANENSVVPIALVLFSGSASLLYLAIAAVVLWKIGHKLIALALPITSLATGMTIFMTPNPSNLNIVFNALRVISFVAYFYAAWLIFVSDAKRMATR